jgi:hypothetical protein
MEQLMGEIRSLLSSVGRNFDVFLYSIICPWGIALTTNYIVIFLQFSGYRSYSRFLFYLQRLVSIRATHSHFGPELCHKSVYKFVLFSEVSASLCRNVFPNSTPKVIKVSHYTWCSPVLARGDVAGYGTDSRASNLGTGLVTFFLRNDIRSETYSHLTCCPTYIASSLTDFNTAGVLVCALTFIYCWF